MNFAKMRKAAGLSQQEAADRLGIERTTVAKWETEKSQPRASLIPKIAELYGCKISALFGTGEAE